jgi:hypothetical protein
MANQCQIYWDRDVQAYRMKMKWSPQRGPQIVDFLKKQIPSSERMWDEQAKIWTFTEKYFDGVAKFAKLLFGATEVVILSKTQVESAQQSYSAPQSRKATPLEIELAEFMQLLPFEAAQSAYRKAAMLLHPDRGGSMEKMTKLNTLWTRIEKEVYNQ